MLNQSIKLIPVLNKFKPSHKKKMSKNREYKWLKYKTEIELKHSS